MNSPSRLETQDQGRNHITVDQPVAWNEPQSIIPDLNTIEHSVGMAGTQLQNGKEDIEEDPPHCIKCLHSLALAAPSKIPKRRLSTKAVRGSEGGREGRGS